MARSLEELNALHARDQEVRTFAKMLTALVKHPQSPGERRAWLEASATTLHEKAAVTAVTSSNYDVFARRFLSGPAGRRLLARLGGFPAPPYARLQSSTSEPDAEWIGEGLPIPLVKPAFSTIVTESSAFGFIVPVTKDVTEMSDERATSAIEQIAARVMVRVEDRKLLGTDAAVSGVNPAGLLAAAPEFTGGSPSSLETDLEQMYAYVVDGQATRAVLITSPRAAVWMGLQTTERGARFPDVREDGSGHLVGIPLFTSPAAGAKVILVDAGELVIVDDGLEVSASQQAAVAMDDSPTTGAAQLVSGWQTNTTFLRFIRRAWWTLLRDDAVAYTTISELAGSPA